MQYWQRRLQRSVTEMRRLRSGRSKRSRVKPSLSQVLRSGGSDAETLEDDDQRRRIAPRGDHGKGAERRRLALEDGIGRRGGDHGRGARALVAHVEHEVQAVARPETMGGNNGIEGSFPELRQ